MKLNKIGHASWGDPPARTETAENSWYRRYRVVVDSYIKIECHQENFLRPVQESCCRLTKNAKTAERKKDEIYSEGC